MEELWRLSAKDIAALVRSKKVSAKEAATAALARLDAVNPAINAVVDHRRTTCWRRRAPSMRRWRAARTQVHWRACRSR